VFHHQMERDKILIGLRPAVDAANVYTDTSGTEKFQNEVLRPVVKLQYSVLMHYFSHYLIKKKIYIQTVDHVTKVKIIEKMLQNDTYIRNLLIGSIIGLLSENEMERYCENEPEYRNRIIKLLTRRFTEEIRF